MHFSCNSTPNQVEIWKIVFAHDDNGYSVYQHGKWRDKNSEHLLSR